MIKVLSSYDSRIKNAGFKAKYDIERIISAAYEDCEICAFDYDDSKIKTPMKAYMNSAKRLLSFLFRVKRGDIAVVQHPISLGSYTFFNKVILRKAKTKICIVHDLDGLRNGSKELSDNQNSFIKAFDHVISHNENMTEFLIKNGVDKNKIINLELFDYLCDDWSERKNLFNRKSPKVVYSGNLLKEKCPFVYQLSDVKLRFDINLYGNGLNGSKINNKKVHEKGCFSPNFPSEIEGDLGLVWDGDASSFVDENTVKNYNKYNNPHKLSCYIAAGIPVIVWRKAAIAKFVEENNIGYLIDEITDINSLDYSDYDIKFKNVQKISKRVREGYYIKKALKKAL